MHLTSALAIDIVGFLGAWLLVASSIYQASIELGHEEIDRTGLIAAKQSVQVPTSLSPWWWLLPPIAYWKWRRQSRLYREAVLSALTTEQVEQWVSFSAKATGWLMVGASGVLLASKETWGLVNHLRWPTWIFWPIAAGAFLLCALHTVLRQRRGRSFIQATETRRTSG